MSAPALPAATFFQRCSAWVFDTSLALWPAGLMGYLATGDRRRALAEQQAQALAHLDSGLAYLHDLAGLYAYQGAWTLFWVAVIYGTGSVLAEGGLAQATWGKRLAGISVEAMPGREDDRTAAGKRFLAGALSWASLNVGHAMAAWRKDGRAFHDLATGWRVVQESMPARVRRQGMAICWTVALGTHALLAFLFPTDPVLMSLASQALAGLG